MATPKKPAFSPAAYLANSGVGRRILEIKPKRSLFVQGNDCDSIFYIQKGRVKITVVSTQGKEATITLLGPGDFAGEEAIGAVSGLRLATATAITACTVLKIEPRRDDPRDAQGARLLRPLPGVPAGPLHADAGRPGRPALQLQREAAGADPAADGRVRPAGQAGDADPARSRRRRWRR